MYNIAINGFGRIGRSILRAWVERYDSLSKHIQIVAINELADAKTAAHLTQYDSTHGRFPCSVTQGNGQLHLALAETSPNRQNHHLQLSHHSQIEDLDWRQQSIDVVLECTGAFADRATAERHLQAGAKQVIFSQPAERDVDATVVFGVNHHLIQATDKILSNSSCTSNAIIPVIDALQQSFGIEAGVIRTLHSMMHDQPIIDAYHHTDLRKTRAAFVSMIPVDTSLAAGIERIFPEMSGRFEAHAMRVPTLNVSAIDISITLSTDATIDKVHQRLKHYCNHHPTLFGYTNEPLASCDFNHDPRSAIIDLNQTRLAGKRLLKMMIWFDNEWGYANRMLDLTHYLLTHDLLTN